MLNCSENQYHRTYWCAFGTEDGYVIKKKHKYYNGLLFVNNIKDAWIFDNINTAMRVQANIGGSVVDLIYHSHHLIYSSYLDFLQYGSDFNRRDRGFYT